MTSATSPILVKLETAQTRQKAIERSIRHRVRQGIARHIVAISCGSYRMTADHFISLFALTLRTLCQYVRFEDDPNIRSGARLLLPKLAGRILFDEILATGELRDTEVSMLAASLVAMDSRRHGIVGGNSDLEFQLRCGWWFDRAAARVLVEWSGNPPKAEQAFTQAAVELIFGWTPEPRDRGAEWDRFQNDLAKDHRDFSKEWFAQKVLGVTRKTFHAGYFGTKTPPRAPAWPDDHVLVLRTLDLMTLPLSVWPKKGEITR